MRSFSMSYSSASKRRSCTMICLKAFEEAASLSWRKVYLAENLRQFGRILSAISDKKLLLPMF